MLSQSFVDGHRIERCARAIADLAHEVGPRAVTATLVTARARMARGTFYALFDGRDGAMECACAVARRALLVPVEAAAEAPGDRGERLEATIGALLEAVSEEPRLAELCLVHSASLRDRGGPFDREVVDALMEIMEELLPHRPDDRILSYSELASYAILSIVTGRLLAGKAADLGEMRGELTAIVSNLYLGLDELAIR